MEIDQLNWLFRIVLWNTNYRENDVYAKMSGQFRCLVRKWARNLSTLLLWYWTKHAVSNWESSAHIQSFRNTKCKNNKFNLIMSQIIHWKWARLLPTTVEHPELVRAVGCAHKRKKTKIKIAIGCMSERAELALVQVATRMQSRIIGLILADRRSK